jgi:uncharacterized membrane protein
MFYLWYKRGRDTKFVGDNIYYKPENVKTQTVKLFSRKHIPFVYHPIDGLSPAEVGTIIDERVNIRDVVAEMVELSRLGFFKIVKIEKDKLIGKDIDYAFVKEDKYEDSSELKKLKDYQRLLLREVFRSTVIHKSVESAEKLFKNEKEKLKKVRKLLIDKKYTLLSALKNHFYEALPDFKEKLYKRMEKEGFFDANPEKIRTKWLGLFFALFVASLFVVIQFIVRSYNFYPLIIIILSFAPGIIIAIKMPKRTANGYSLFRQIEGLKWYLKKGKWRHEIAEKKLFFEDVLPLAIALNVVRRLSKDMQELNAPPPNYMVGMTSGRLVNDISTFNQSSSSTFMSSPSGKWSSSSSWSGGSGFSSGGGFSGGGFGGGGGGSW